VEQALLHGRIKAITAYYGDLVVDPISDDGQHIYDDDLTLEDWG
jgi:hypothetical protein